MEIQRSFLGLIFSVTSGGYTYFKINSLIHMVYQLNKHK